MRLWAWLHNAVAKRAEALQYRAYMRSLLQNLRDHPQAIGQEHLLQERIQELYNEALRRHSGLIVDDRAQTHLQVACLVQGSYKALLPWFRNDTEKVIELIRKPLGESAAGVVGILQKIGLYFTVDKFSLMSKNLKYMDLDFGKFFLVTHRISSSSHTASVRRCLYNTVFTEDGVPELTPIFCTLDRMWFDQIHPAKHGMRFSRSSTLADGAPSCEFVLEKTGSKNSSSM